MNKTAVSSLLIATVLSFGQANAAAQDQPAAPAVQQAAVSELPEAVVEKIGTPEAGKALVVFFREKKFAGSGIRFKVRENDVELGKLTSGVFFAVNVEPGMHTYVVHSEAKDVTTIEAEAGQTYFMVGTVSMGFLAGHPNLTLTNVAEFEGNLPKLKPAKPLK